MQWAAFDSISPIGDERAFDLGPALIRKTLVELKGAKDVELRHFMPFGGRQEEQEDGTDRPRFEQAAEEMMMRWAENMGARG